MRKIIYSVFTALLFLFTACAGDVESEYARRNAYFVLSNTNTVITLNGALSNMGEFCTIENEPNQFRFRSLTGSDVVNKTAVHNYSGFNMGLSGFIVGLPNIPEVGTMQSKVVCYDRTCSNCYEDYVITRNVELQEGGFARCGSCTRVYNLNDNGLVVSDTTGVRLYKYRVSYSPYILSIRN